MPSLQLESNTDVFHLDDILFKGRGVQVRAGVTGLGFPPVRTQWLEGAGDGATYRGKRVPARDIDLPLLIEGDNREDLKALVSRLALMLAGECTLRFIEDDGSSWWAKVHRVGGGEYMYGGDTTGERDLMIIVTLRAGDPYFTSSRAIRKSISNAGSSSGLLPFLGSMQVASSQAIGDILLENPGDVHAYPVWEVTGPGRDFVAQSASGESFHWTGVLTAQERLEVDTQRGTVIDQSGANRYGQLAPAPRLWHVPPGTTSAIASLSDTSPGTLGPSGPPLRTNIVTNPSVEVDQVGWSVYAPVAGPTLARDLSRGSRGAVSLRATSTPDNKNQLGATYGGFSTVGDGGRYVTIGVDFYVPTGSPVESVVIVVRDDVAGVTMATPLVTPVTIHDEWQRHIVSWRIPEGNQLTRVYASGYSSSGLAGDHSVWIDGLTVEAAVTDGSYFDGATANSSTSGWHAWTGVAHASTSTKQGTVITGRSSITCAWRPRRWLVI